MKYRESGMPTQDYWETLFDIPLILRHFRFCRETLDVAELGCGYGTFTLPLAKMISGTVRAIDVDAEMVERVRRRAAEERVTNIDVKLRDISDEGFGVAAQSCDACLLFNILHGEDPLKVLREAERVVRPGGSVAVLHWRTDIPTPRGPSADIRPDPEEIIQWVRGIPSLTPSGPACSLGQWHYGIILHKRATSPPTM